MKRLLLGSLLSCMVFGCAGAAGVAVINAVRREVALYDFLYLANDAIVIAHDPNQIGRLVPQASEFVSRVCMPVDPHAWQNRSMQQRCTDAFIARGVGTPPATPPTFWDGINAMRGLSRIYTNAEEFPAALPAHMQLDRIGIDGRHQGHRVCESVRSWERARDRFDRDTVLVAMAAVSLLAGGATLYKIGADPLKRFMRDTHKSNLDRLGILFQGCAGNSLSLCGKSVPVFRTAMELLPEQTPPKLALVIAAGFGSVVGASALSFAATAPLFGVFHLCKIGGILIEIIKQKL